MATKTYQLPELYEGKSALCFCCTETLPIQLVGIDRDLSTHEWIASENLVEAIHVDLTVLRVEEFKKGRLLMKAVCCYMCGIPIYNGKHYWLNTEPTDTDGRFIQGAYCQKCLPKAIMACEDSTGRLMPMVAYAVNYTADVDLTPHRPAASKAANDNTEVTLAIAARAFPIF